MQEQPESIQHSHAYLCQRKQRPFAPAGQRWRHLLGLGHALERRPESSGRRDDLADLLLSGHGVEVCGHQQLRFVLYYAPGNIHVTGYALTLTNTAEFSQPGPLTNLNVKMSAPRTWQVGPTTVQYGPVSQRVLLADANLENNGIWNSVQGGYTVNGKPFDHTSAHLTSLGKPSGGNLAMIDGHVEWREFKFMIQRTDTTSGVVGEPAYWW